MAQLVEALGAEVQHFSREYQCCGGAGGFHGTSRGEAEAFTRRKLDAIKEETDADLIVVSCITCLMHLDNVQQDLNKRGNGNGNGSSYDIPVFDYNQLLALCLGHPAKEVAAISTMPRERITERFD
jgi:heterodisulfide reductase subunit B